MCHANTPNLRHCHPQHTRTDTYRCEALLGLFQRYLLAFARVLRRDAFVPSKRSHEKFNFTANNAFLEDLVTQSAPFDIVPLALRQRINATNQIYQKTTKKNDKNGSKKSPAAHSVLRFGVRAAAKGVALAAVLALILVILCLFFGAGGCVCVCVCVCVLFK